MLHGQTRGQPISQPIVLMIPWQSALLPAGKNPPWSLALIPSNENQQAVQRTVTEMNCACLLSGGEPLVGNSNNSPSVGVSVKVALFTVTCTMVSSSEKLIERGVVAQPLRLGYRFLFLMVAEERYL